MQNNEGRVWRRIIDVAALIAVLTLVVALVQLWQSNMAANSQDSAQSTQIALLKKQLDVQNQIATLESSSLGVGPTSTVIAQRIIELEGTRVALATEEAKVKKIPQTDLTMTIPANVEWVSTGIAIERGDTVDIQYISGKWRGVKDGYWSDGTSCDGPQPGSMVSSANGNALIAKINYSSVPKGLNVVYLFRPGDQ